MSIRRQQHLPPMSSGHQTGTPVQWRAEILAGAYFDLTDVDGHPDRLSGNLDACVTEAAMARLDGANRPGDIVEYRL